jgi:hypothetical protein
MSSPKRYVFGGVPVTRRGPDVSLLWQESINKDTLEKTKLIANQQADIRRLIEEKNDLKHQLAESRRELEVVKAQLEAEKKERNELLNYVTVLNEAAKQLL